MSGLGTARLRYLRMTARKVRLVASLIRGKQVEQALHTLNFTSKAAALPVARLLKSAVANASQKQGVNVDKLYVKSIFVDGGPSTKRFLPRAHGRATRILKRTSHLTIVLDQK